MTDSLDIKPTVKVDFKQIIIIVLIILLFISIPFIISYVQNPEKRSVSDIISHTFESFKIKSLETEEPYIFKVPLFNTDLDLTVVKQNPMLVTYAGVVLLFISTLITITLIRNIRRK